LDREKKYGRKGKPMAKKPAPPKPKTLAELAEAENGAKPGDEAASQQNNNGSS